MYNYSANKVKELIAYNTSIMIQVSLVRVRVHKKAPRASISKRTHEGLAVEANAKAMAYKRTMPLKPIKAIAKMPADIRAMGIPRKATGISVRANCSLIPAKTTIASVKPIAVEIA